MFNRVAVNINNVRPWVSVDEQRVVHIINPLRILAASVCSPNSAISFGKMVPGKYLKPKQRWTATVNWHQQEYACSLVRWCLCRAPEAGRRANPKRDQFLQVRSSARCRLPSAVVHPGCPLVPVDEIRRGYCRDYYRSESYCCERHWWGGCKLSCPPGARKCPTMFRLPWAFSRSSEMVPVGWVYHHLRFDSVPRSTDAGGIKPLRVG